MDELVYNAICNYFNALTKTGYISDSQTYKLLLLIFYRDFIFEDYRGILNREDYALIEKALDCLYGSSCLISYPDYLKMGKLHLGEMTEMAQRMKALEDTDVIKLMTTEDDQSDVLVVTEEN